MFCLFGWFVGFDNVGLVWLVWLVLGCDCNDSVWWFGMVLLLPAGCCGGEWLLWVWFGVVYCCDFGCGLLCLRLLIMAFGFRWCFAVGCGLLLGLGGWLLDSFGV